MEYRIALIIGRFQPFHLGHLYLLKKTLEIAEKVVFGIGSASIYDENNPLSYEERKTIIQKVIDEEGFKERVIKIVPLEDFFDDKKWLQNIKNKVGKFDVVISNNDWTNKIMEQAGYKVIREPYFKRNLYEGWRIRKLARHGKRWKNRVPNYIVKLLNDQIVKKKQFSNLAIQQFNHIVLGGTFDHFHKGHQTLLKKAFEVGKKVTIGIATEELYKDKFLSKTIESFETRKKSVSSFLDKKRWLVRAKIISFSEFTGGADNNRDIEAIVVSRLTYPNSLKINELREKNKLKPLRIIIVKDVLDEDGELLSSERIRAGEIDRNGRVYSMSLRAPTQSGRSNLIMPENLREELRKPLGEVYKNTQEVVGAILESPKKPLMIIAVGDIIVDELIKEGTEPDIKVIDFRSRRRAIPAPQRVIPSVYPEGEVEESNKKISPLTSFGRNDRYVNKPGTINLKTAEKLRTIIKGTVPTRDSPYNSWLIIDGEEDLLTLPAILFAPLSSLVLYGHWQYGIIGVEVTEKSKKKAKLLLNRFKI